MKLLLPGSATRDVKLTRSSDAVLVAVGGAGLGDAITQDGLGR